jgi:hypothetical protein
MKDILFLTTTGIVLIVLGISFMVSDYELFNSLNIIAG